MNLKLLRLTEAEELLGKAEEDPRALGDLTQRARLQMRRLQVTGIDEELDGPDMVFEMAHSPLPRPETTVMTLMRKGAIRRAGRKINVDADFQKELGDYLTALHRVEKAA